MSTDGLYKFLIILLLFCIAVILGTFLVYFADFYKLQGEYMSWSMNELTGE